MTQKSAHTTKAGNAILDVESRPFSELPGQSQLFLDYQHDPLSLTEFYPAAVASHTDVRQRVAAVLQNYTADRNVLCDALLEKNRQFFASQKAIENIEELRQADCIAVVTGQQAGLFSGPLYTVYKAFSAVKLSETLRNSGVKAVPVFWVASEDHDFDEVSNAFVIDSGGGLRKIVNQPSERGSDLPVGMIELDGSIDSSIEELIGDLPPTEFTSELSRLLSGTWQAGHSFSHSFASLIAKIFSDYGLIVIDPLDETLKRLAAPIYSAAIERSSSINDALLGRSRRLEEVGYHAQVKVDRSYFPLFWHDDDERRISLKFTTRGTVVTKDKSREFTLGELKEIAEIQPSRFSPNVMLRPVVQDFLLPTICYFGGAAEISYFAQNAVVYELLGRPVTTILHRQSLTFVEPKLTRILDALDFEFKDLFSGIDQMKMRAAETNLAKDSARIFAETEERINTELNRLDQHIAPNDPTVAANLAKRRCKMLYHVAAIREKFYLSQLKKDETLSRRIDALFNHLLPNGQLQERVLNISYFLDLHGLSYLDWIYESIDLDDRGHRIIYL